MSQVVSRVQVVVLVSVLGLLTSLPGVAAADIWPVQPGILTIGDFHACGVGEDSTARCWGSSDNGRTVVPDGATFTDLAAGGAHTCGITRDGTARCWGANWGDQAVPPTGVSFTTIAAGAWHTCGITDDGTARCWGWNSHGQTVVPHGTTFTAIVAGRLHTCGITITGSTRCWGENGHGQADVPHGVTFTALAVGDTHTCGITRAGHTLCWGHNGQGQTVVPDAVTFTAIAAGSQHTCGITDYGTARCWGGNSHGQSDVPSGATFTAIAASGPNTCGVTVDGTARCWGDTRYGQALVPSGVRFGSDLIPPTITSSLDRVANPAGWHNDPFTITYVCTDNWGPVDCPDPTTITDDGADRPITASVTDASGRSAVVVDVINLDTTAPDVHPMVVESPNGSGWHNVAPTVTFECADTLSGVATCHAPITVTDDGASQQITGTGIDIAGNTGQASTTVNLDTDQPTTTIAPQVVGSTLSGTITDALSGPAKVTATLVPALGTGTIRIDATVDCTRAAYTAMTVMVPRAETSCGWTADAPAGVWRVHLSGTDIADNVEASHDAGTVIIIGT